MKKPANSWNPWACRIPGVSDLIRAVYHLLGLRTYLTTGVKETPGLDHPGRGQGPPGGGRHPHGF